MGMVVLNVHRSPRIKHIRSEPADEKRFSQQKSASLDKTKFGLRIFYIFVSSTFGFSEKEKKEYVYSDKGSDICFSRHYFSFSLSLSFFSSFFSWNGAASNISAPPSFTIIAAQTALKRNGKIVKNEHRHKLMKYL